MSSPVLKSDAQFLTGKPLKNLNQHVHARKMAPSVNLRSSKLQRVTTSVFNNRTHLGSPGEVPNSTWRVPVSHLPGGMESGIKPVMLTRREIVGRCHAHSHVSKS